MLKLTTHEASVLARLAQYDQLPFERIGHLIDSLTGNAHKVGLIIINRKNTSTFANDIQSAAQRIMTWAQRNRIRPRFKNNRSKN